MLPQCRGHNGHHYHNNPSDNPMAFRIVEWRCGPQWRIPQPPSAISMSVLLSNDRIFRLRSISTNTVAPSFGLHQTRLRRGDARRSAHCRAHWDNADSRQWFTVLFCFCTLSFRVFAKSSRISTDILDSHAIHIVCSCTSVMVRLPPYYSRQDQYTYRHFA